LSQRPRRLRSRQRRLLKMEAWMSKISS
jgi:hypothetical protein